MLYLTSLYGVHDLHTIRPGSNTTSLPQHYACTRLIWNSETFFEDKYCLTAYERLAN